MFLIMHTGLRWRKSVEGQSLAESDNEAARYRCGRLSVHRVWVSACKCQIDPYLATCRTGIDSILVEAVNGVFWSMDKVLRDTLVIMQKPQEDSHCGEEASRQRMRDSKKATTSNEVDKV